MITDKMTNIVLMVGFVFLILPFLLHVFSLLYRWGFFGNLKIKGFNWGKK